MKAAGAAVPRLWTDDAASTVSSSRLGAAVLIAGALHLIALLGLGFELPDRTPYIHTTPPLEVLVVRDPTLAGERPDQPDALAQVDQTGGGIDNASERADSAVEQTPSDADEPTRRTPPLPPAPEPFTRSEPPPRSTLTATMATEPSETQTTSPVTAPPPPPVSASQILASRNQEIAELTARIEETTLAYANRPRRKAISASTREYKYATYLEAWRRKVERIGNLNYPDEAKRRRLYGNLILHVAVRADGSLDGVRVVRSSGFDVLDEAAVRIVKLAAPFAPLPPDIRAEADILDITRTWQFLSSNRLGWEN
jgi:protein TonB